MQVNDKKIFMAPISGFFVITLYWNGEGENCHQI